MPVVEPGSKVLVTGANGFVGMWVTRTYLEDGYSVQGAVRTAEKGEKLKTFFASYGDKFDFVVVEDITKEGAFDEIVKHVDAISHLASPAHLPVDGRDPDEYIGPAMAATLGIYQSAAKAGPRLKRIVFTSSVSAVLTPPVPGEQRTFDERDWGDENVRIVGEAGKSAKGIDAYNASKTLAEQAATEFYNSHKSEVSWDMVALCPSLTIGRPLQEINAINELSTSMALWYYAIFTEKPEAFLKLSYSFGHIEDVARAHSLSLRKENIGGERFIISSGQITWQETRDTINSVDAKYYTSGILPRGNPDLDRTVHSIFKTDKSKELLGMSYKGAKEVFGDVVDYLAGRGLLKY